MRRTTNVVLIIGVVALAIVVAGAREGLGATELLVILGILIASGIGPFTFGVAVRLLWKEATVPAAVPWVFGITLGLIRFIAPQFGGLTILDSKLLSALLSGTLGVAFSELGIAAATAAQRRREARNEASTRV